MKWKWGDGKDISCEWEKGNQGLQYSSDKIDFKINSIKKDKEGHYLMIKGTIQKENITLIDVCVPNIGTPNTYNKY